MNFESRLPDDDCPFSKVPYRDASGYRILPNFAIEKGIRIIEIGVAGHQILR